MIHRVKTALFARWWVMLLSVLLVGGPILVYAWMKAPVFQSDAIMWMTVRLNLTEGKMMSEEMSTYMGTQAELLNSFVVQFRAYDKVLAKFPDVADAETNAILDASKLPFQLNVKSSQKSTVIGLSATGPSPDATRYFLDSVMDGYLTYKKDSRKQTSFGALSIITDQVKEAERQVATLQSRMAEFATSNNISYLTEHGQSAGKHLADLGSLISDLRTESQLLQLLTPDQVKEIGERPKGAANGPQLPGEKTALNLFQQSGATTQPGYYQVMQQYQILKAKRDDLEKNLRPTHSKMIKINQEIAGLERLTTQLDHESQQQAGAQLASRRQSVDLQIQNLETQYRNWETNAMDASRKLAYYNIMQEDLKRAQALYDRLVGLVQTVDLNKGLDQEPLTPLAPASTARPTMAKLKIAIAGVFLSFMLGGGVILLLEVMDDRFKSVVDLSLQMTEPILVQIPESTLPKRNGKVLPLKNRDERYAFAEAFRNLRSSILFMSDHEHQPRTILITSAVPDEGKTTIATNFAASLAMAGSRVLLIDADLRRSGLHAQFKVAGTPGLREVLNRQIPASKAIVPVQWDPATSGEALSGIRDSLSGTGNSVPSLFLLPAGEAADSSSELFLSGTMDTLLQAMAKEYDYVVIDSAPVLATDDATSLAPKTDGVLMVVRASYTSSRLAREALDRLRKRRVNVLGVIYNRAAASTDSYYRYSKQYGARIAGPLVGQNSGLPVPRASGSENSKV